MVCRGLRQVLYPPVSRQPGWLQACTFSWSARTAATMITRIGRTSSDLRVLKPQYGYVDLWSRVDLPPRLAFLPRE